MQPEYFDNYVHKPEELYAELLKLSWLNITEARKEYFMSYLPREYTYGKGNGIRTYKSNYFHYLISNLQQRINKEFNTEYNVCFLNYYTNEKQHLGWHADDSPEMDEMHAIACISLGAEREIWWKLKDYKGVIPKEFRRQLKNGSLFVMPTGFQDLYYHKIPKHDKPCGPRISLTFRKYRI